jgi:RecJ-like exonuclease
MMAKVDLDNEGIPCPSCNGAGKVDIVEPNRNEIMSASLALIDTIRADTPAAHALVKSLIKRGWQPPTS